MLREVHLLWRKRQVLKELTVSNLKGKYSGSILGIFWAILYPLLIMGAITVIFTIVLGIEVHHFPLFVLSAILPWIFFSNSLSEASYSFIDKASVLRQFSLPKESIPLSTLGANFLNFLIGLGALLPVFILFNPEILPFIALLPVVLVLHLLFTSGLCLLLSWSSILFPDLRHLLSVGLMLWFWMTPIFYSVEMVPEKFRGLVYMNPMTSYIVLYRRVLFEGKVGDLKVYSLGIIFSLLSLFVGYLSFLKKKERIFKKL
ncbi:MAG TPA: ABC transporter permease [Candidatus Omnitrophica bacterium]|nr:ABC transporter permease [Candidatus Omnitrophota bacterium]